MDSMEEAAVDQAMAMEVSVEMRARAEVPLRSIEAKSFSLSQGAVEAVRIVITMGTSVVMALPEKTAVTVGERVVAMDQIARRAMMEALGWVVHKPQAAAAAQV